MLSDKEVDKLIEWFNQIGGEGELSYSLKGKVVKAVPVGKKETLGKYGINPYLNRIKHELKENGTDHILMMALGIRNVTATLMIERLILEDKELEIKNRFVKFNKPMSIFHITRKNA